MCVLTYERKSCSKLCIKLRFLGYFLSPSHYDHNFQILSINYVTFNSVKRYFRYNKKNSLMETGDRTKCDPKTGNFQALYVMGLNHELLDYPCSPSKINFKNSWFSRDMNQVRRPKFFFNLFDKIDT